MQSQKDYYMYPFEINATEIKGEVLSASGRKFVTRTVAGDDNDYRAATMLRKKKMAGYLTEEALRRGSTDNTTVAIVWLQ